MSDQASQILVAGEKNDEQDKVEPLAHCHPLTIHYDPETQTIAALRFKGAKEDPPHFKTWEFIVAVLGMAQEYAKVQLQISRAMQAQQQMQDEMIRQNIINGPRMRNR